MLQDFGLLGKLQCLGLCLASDDVSHTVGSGDEQGLPHDG